MALNQTFNQDSSGNIGVAGIANTSSPTYSNGVENPLSLTLAGALRTDSSAVTQPISAVSLPLPTGASTSALQTTGNTSLATIATNTTGLNLTIGATGATVPADAILVGVKNGANIVALTEGSATSANSIPVVVASDQVVNVALPVSNTPTLTSVASSATSVTLLAASGTTKGWIIFNDSTSVLYVAFGGTASTTSFTSKLFPNSQLTSELTYTGAISGIWATANGFARITQLT